MSALDDRMLAVAERLLTKYGRDVSYVEEGTYDPTDGSVSDVAQSKKIRVSPPDPSSLRKKVGDSALTQSMIYVITQASVKVGGKISLDGDVYRITAIDPLSSGEKNAAYGLLCQR